LRIIIIIISLCFTVQTSGLVAYYGMKPFPTVLAEEETMGNEKGVEKPFKEGDKLPYYRIAPDFSLSLSMRHVLKNESFLLPAGYLRQHDQPPRV